MAHLALEMLGVATELGLGLRVGIDTGPVVAGVLGTTKYSYDLWGTTVNRASRMESEGKAGAILVTDAFAESAGREFEFEPGGTKTLKGLGEVEGLWLLRRKTKELPLDSRGGGDS
jgi:class 3 adenylate cyclase